MSLAAVVSEPSRAAQRAAPAGLLRRLGKLLGAKNFLSLSDQAVVSGTSFVTSVMIGRLCSQDELGVYALALTVVGVIRSVHCELVGAPFCVFSHRHEDDELATYCGSVTVHQFVLTLLSVLALAAFYAAGEFGLLRTSIQPVLGVLLVAAPFLWLREFLRGFLFGRFRVGVAFAVDTVVAIGQLGGLALLALTGRLTVASGFAVMGAACAAAGLAGLWLHREPVRIRRTRIVADWRSNWQFARWTLASHLVGSTTPFVMPWIVESLRGPAVTGSFAACVTLIGLSTMFVTGVANVLTPSAARAFYQGGAGQLRPLLIRTALLFTVVLGTFCTIVLFRGEWLMAFVYGNKFTGLGPVCLWLALASWVNSLGVTAGNGLWALERPQANLVADACTLTVTLTAAALLVGPWGAYGAGLAMLLGITAGTTVRCATLVRWLRHHRRQLTPLPTPVPAGA